MRGSLECVDLSTVLCRYIDTSFLRVSFRKTYHRSNSIVPLGVYHLTPNGFPPLLAAGECSGRTQVMSNEGFRSCSAIGPSASHLTRSRSFGDI